MSFVRRSVVVLTVVATTVIGGGFASAADGVRHAVRFAIVETRGIEVRPIAADPGAATSWEVRVEGIGGWLDVRATDLEPDATLELRTGAEWVPADAAGSIALEPAPALVGLRLVAPATSQPPAVRAPAVTLTLSAA